MQLERFRVTHFRSVKDSGWVEVGGRTALVGGNESGKTNLLRALRALNPHEGPEPLSVTRDFPADRLRSEYDDSLPVVQTVWRLSAEDRDALAEVFPRAAGVARVEVWRGYPAEREVRFCDLPEAQAPVEQARKLVARVRDAAEGSEDPIWDQALDALAGAAGSHGDDARAWATAVSDALAGLQQPLQLGQVTLAPEARTALEELGDLAAQVGNESEYESAARQWVLSRLPTFLFLDDYPVIDGQQNLADFVQRQQTGQRKPGDEYFEMLLRVGGIDADTLEEMLRSDHETRRQMASRAGAALTRRLRELWSDRAIKVRFNLDGEHWNTLVADPTELYDVEINLNERSRGFQWFFSFYVMFAASTADGSGRDAVVLLDEPGLHLHAVGQRDLMTHLAGLPNQVLYTTQSPFLVPTDDLESVRAVSFDEREGTRVASGIEGDARTLMPVAHAIGAELARGLFDGEPVLVVPDVTDYWYLRAAAHFLAEQGSPALPKGLQITPAGGAARIGLLTALLAVQPEGTPLLLAPDAAGLGAAGEALRAHLEERGVIFLGEGFDAPRPEGADVEDLLDAEMYDRFVRFAYRKELGDRELELDASIPRVVRRYEQALAALDLEFSRARPARLILRGAAQNPQPLFPDASRARFERLFGVIRERFEGRSA